MAIPMYDDILTGYNEKTFCNGKLQGTMHMLYACVPGTSTITYLQSLTKKKCGNFPEWFLFPPFI